MIENGKWSIRAVAMLVENEGKILLVRENGSRESIGKYSGMLSIPMGHIEDGEDPPIAALREFKEETGLSAKIDYSLGVFQIEMANKRRAGVWAYEGHLIGGSKEISSVVWLDEVGFLSLDPFLLRPLNHEIFQLYSVMRRLHDNTRLSFKELSQIIQETMPKASHWTPS